MRRVGVSLVNKKVLVLGSGGASRTAPAAARRGGAAEIVVASRKGPVDYACLRTEHADGQVIINTTPVGMYPANGVSASGGTIGLSKVRRRAWI
jgi:shikimate dehydrogenase